MFKTENILVHTRFLPLHKNYTKTEHLKNNSVSYLRVSVSWEFGSSSGGCLWLRVSYKGVIQYQLRPQSSEGSNKGRMHLQAPHMVGAGHPRLIFHLAVHKVEAGLHQKEQEREDKVEATAFL